MVLIGKIRETESTKECDDCRTFRAGNCLRLLAPFKNKSRTKVKDRDHPVGSACFTLIDRVVAGNARSAGSSDCFSIP
jgi:hypothetical protein